MGLSRRLRRVSSTSGKCFALKQNFMRLGVALSIDFVTVRSAAVVSPPLPPPPMGGGGSGGETTAADPTGAKSIDKATPNLMKVCFNAKHFPQVLLTLRKRGESPIDYLKIKMKNGLISSVHPGGNADAPGAESVSFAFDAVEVEYTPQGPDGKAQGAVTMKWDIKKNKEG